MKVYEYVVVMDWLDNLEKGTRLYYDYQKGGYVYHYENERSVKNQKYNMTSTTVEDYFISAEMADRNILRGQLAIGPELGNLEKLGASNEGRKI